MSQARDLADRAGDITGRNLIINGAMKVAQRGTSATASSGYNTVDRFQLTVANMDNAAYTYVQSSVAPTGFSNSWRIDCTTVESALAADEYSTFTQAIEAQNLQQISNGSSAAKSLTLSFYVKSNKTGTWGLNLYKPDNTGRQITATYTISSADTWEYKTITFAGDTAGGGIANDNGAGMYVYWALAAGSDYTSSDSTSWSNYSNAGFLYGHNVNFFDSTANDWAVTGVQLEVGQTATPFEHEDFGTTLAKCQRYYFKSLSTSSADAFAVGQNNTTQRADGSLDFSVTMRASPTAIETTGTATDYLINTAGSNYTCNAVPSFIRANSHTAYFRFPVASGLTTGNGAMLRSAVAGAYLAWSAEL